MPNSFYLKSAAPIAVLAFFATSASATQVLGYAQNSSSNTVAATQNSGATATSLSIVDVPITITNYLGGGTPIAATINLTASSSNSATLTLGVINQNYTGTFCITSGPACSGTNYLSGTFIDDLTGASGGSQFTLGASTPPGANVTFTSDILSPPQLEEARALSLSFSNVIPPIGICGTTICSFTASQSGTMSANNTVLPPAQLGVAKTPDNGTFTQGSQLTFTIVVSNSAALGSQSANNVTLSDQLPGNGGLVWSSASTTQGSCTTPIVGNLLNCSLGTIPPQGSVTVTVTSAPTTPGAACQSQPNPVALATADGGLSAQDSGSLTCASTAQLSVVKTPDNGTFTQGSQLTYTIVVSNPAASGSQSATNVTLSDQLPGNGGLVWGSASTTQGSCTTPIVGNLLNCSLGTIPPQGSVTVTVTSAPTTPAAACQSQPNPVALATADNGLSAQDSGSLSCTSNTALNVVKTPDNGTFTQGSQLSFAIVVSNPSASGSLSATNVMLSDQLPGNGGLVWSSASTTQGTCATPIVGNLLNCSLGTIPPQGSVTVIVTSAPTTPAAACQSQPNPVALATADNGLSAQDSGSLSCAFAPPSRLEPIPAPGIIATALAFLLGAFAFGNWRKRR